MNRQTDKDSKREIANGLEGVEGKRKKEREGWGRRGREGEHIPTNYILPLPMLYKPSASVFPLGDNFKPK